MKQKVVISIEGKQFVPGVEPEVIRTHVQGDLEDRGEAGILLTYQESGQTEPERVVTTLAATADRVALERTGALRSQMIFEEGREHQSVYQTPYGTLELVIRTRTLFSNLDSQGGEIRLAYDLALGGAETGRNTLWLQVRPMEGTKEKI